MKQSSPKQVSPENGSVVRSMSRAIGSRIGGGWLSSTSSSSFSHTHQSYHAPLLPALLQTSPPMGPWLLLRCTNSLASPPPPTPSCPNHHLLPLGEATPPLSPSSPSLPLPPLGRFAIPILILRLEATEEDGASAKIEGANSGASVD
jgi:hypothetical protein